MPWDEKGMTLINSLLALRAVMENGKDEALLKLHRICSHQQPNTRMMMLSIGTVKLREGQRSSEYGLKFFLYSVHAADVLKGTRLVASLLKAGTRVLPTCMMAHGSLQKVA